MKLAKRLILASLTLFLTLSAYARESGAGLNPDDINLNTQWQGKKIGFLGDSMTDPNNSSAETHYWTYLKHLLGIEPHVFARSGFEWERLLSKAEEMHQAMGDSIDAVIIWCGTNDYNQSREIGQFYTETVDSTNVNGKMLVRKHRTLDYNSKTLCGGINRVMSYLKETYPTKQIIIMTPIHRGLANFNDHNVQPDENYANGQDLYLETYIDIIKQGAALWSVPVIDLYATSGIVPNLDSNTRYISKEKTDRLHPNSEGHYRIARTIQTSLLTLPASF